MKQGEKVRRFRLGLRFEDEALERDFQVHYDRTFRSYFKLGLAVGTLLFASFGLLDRIVFPTAWQALWWWRYAFCLPPLLFTLSALHLLPGHRWVQPLLAVTASLVGLGTVGMFYDASPGNYSFFYSGLMLVIFYAHAFVRLQFAWATLATLVIFLGHEAALALLWKRMALEQVVTGHSFLLAAIFGGMGTSYSLERDARNQFLLQRRLDRERRRLQELNQKLDRLAHVDELTGIANRRSFMEQLALTWRDQLRKGDAAAPLGLLLVDIDHFKAYNDRYGHPAGDRCLREVAAVIAGFARRPRDLAARIGGEEFVLLLPGAGHEDAYRVAESLRRAVAVLDAGLDGPVTVSIGVSSQVPVGSVGSESLLQRADEALYRAKREGRNRVVLAD